MNMHGLTYNLNESHTHRNREATRGRGLENGKMLAKATSPPLLNEYFWKSVYKAVTLVNSTGSLACMPDTVLHT